MRNNVGIINICYTIGSARVLRHALSCEADSTMSSTRRQRAVMATDSEWERIGSAAHSSEGVHAWPSLRPIKDCEVA